MIGIVVVSHSRPLAAEAVALASAMPGAADVTMAVAAGAPDGGLGTDPLAVVDAIVRADSPDGVVVLVDLGSALLASDMALELLSPAMAERVVVTPAPLVEGLVAAAVTAGGGGSRSDVLREATNALAGKKAHLASDDVPPPGAQAGGAAAASVGGTVRPGGGPGVAAVSAIVPVVGDHGIHARPAAVFVAEVRAWNADVRVRNVTTGSDWVPGGSLAGVTTLGAVKGHQLELEASGPDARQALYALVAQAEAGFGEGAGSVAAVVLAEPAPPAGGVPRAASPGYAVGPARHLRSAPVEIPAREAGTPAEHMARLTAAIDAVAGDLADLRAAALRTPGGVDTAIFDAHILLLRDPALLAQVTSQVEAGRSGAAAWNAVLGSLRAQFEAMDDAYLRARAVDVWGLAERVLRNLLGVGPATVTGKGILVAEDLDPGEAASVNSKVVTGIVLAAGSPTSHAAIVARSLGIPMVTGAGSQVLDLPEGTVLAIDGVAGTLTVNPSAAIVTDLKTKAKARRSALKAAAKAAREPAHLADDGPVVPVCANVGSVDDAIRAVSAGADGCGLVRTEFLFQDLRQPPTREAQVEVYRAIAAAMDGRRTVFRTLDAGGDKPIAYLPIPPEDNPFLGVRGLRLCLRYPEVFTDQLMALIEVARDFPVSIMFPMVADVRELREARILTARAAFRQGGSVPDHLKVGIMVEVPCVAMKAAAFAPTVDFFSVGTNDLTQYALAADRGNPAVAGLGDGLDPGVLALIKALTRSARGRASVSVCGELASDPAAAPVLVGLGVRSVSVAPPAIGEVKEAIRGWSRAEARALARRALTCPDAAAVRALLAAPRPVTGL
ncbi:MAG: phosphoenolpyruvate--protein phosphotransferase [Bifidobacteriaceae bacterium]|jgi:phosphocarrier protein FPr|nr:phosphoenolpyruvate--protein phosphotransferase [Bifidobacteriaceae bacterium]